MPSKISAQNRSAPVHDSMVAPPWRDTGHYLHCKNVAAKWTHVLFPPGITLAKHWRRGLGSTRHLGAVYSFVQAPIVANLCSGVSYGEVGAQVGAPGLERICRQA